MDVFLKRARPAITCLMQVLLAKNAIHCHAEVKQMTNGPPCRSQRV